MGTRYLCKTILCCAVLATLPAGALATDNQTIDRHCEASAASFNDLLIQFHALAPLRGHFDGASWNDTIDRYGAQKYCVLDALRLALAQQSPGLNQTIAWLGMPDARWSADQPPQRLIPGESPGTVDEYLWYRWRGERDGLLLAVRQQRVVRVTWSMSGE